MADLDDLIAYLTASPSPWHVVASARARLTEAGFEELANEGGEAGVHLGEGG